jgi:hypothetical protein
MWPTARIRTGLIPKDVGWLSRKGPNIELDKPPASGMWGSVGRACKEVWDVVECVQLVWAICRGTNLWSSGKGLARRRRRDLQVMVE